MLEGLRDRIAQPHILDLFLPEYLSELEVARKEQADRQAGAELRLAEVEREIKHLVTQVRSGAKGFAAQILNDDLHTLGRERDRLKKDLAARPAQPSALPSAEEVSTRLRSLLDELHTALNGPERDAVRARDIVRSFVDKVIITPLPEPGNPKSRVGSTRITVEGPIDALVEEALLDRKIVHSRGAEAVQSPPSPAYRIYMDIAEERTPEREQIAADAVVVGRMLDDAEAPVLRSEMRAAVEERAKVLGGEIGDVERRFRLALASLRRAGLVRRIPLKGLSGYVWAERDMTDAEWQARHRRRYEIRPPIAIIRMQAIQGYAVVIEPSKNPKV